MDASERQPLVINIHDNPASWKLKIPETVYLVTPVDEQASEMSLWMILPVSLPALTITGIWVVYAMALYNQHVCPVENWLYNQSCEEELPLQRGPILCCTLDNVPLISKCGTLPPESCFFSLICSTGSFMVMVIVLLRYAHVIEKHQNCVLNTASLSTGWICAAGLIIVGNFQFVGALKSAVTHRTRAFFKPPGLVFHYKHPEIIPQHKTKTYRLLYHYAGAPLRSNNLHSVSLLLLLSDALISCFYDTLRHSRCMS
ncbi:hypothetical protein ACEWY4_021302 [Coilia grayii]|uniref:CWH43-like N-terminal domain-containing protein n=1 Tax=Coilia grayii TaxID=363190 RepID=A0ABD1J9U7_9TELE